MPGAISSAGKPVESRATAVGFALGLQFELIFQQLNLDQPQSTPDPRFERYARTGAAFVGLAMIRLMLKRLTKPSHCS
jgi:hypothetical protein